LTGSDGVLYDLVGNQIENLTISGSVAITSSLILGGGTFTSASLAAAEAGGDNLGNHTATTELKMAGFSIENVNHITASGNISSSGTMTMLTASIGGGTFTSASLAAGGSGGGGDLSNIVEDTTPQLGGTLDLKTQTISGSGNIKFSGSLQILPLNYLKILYYHYH
jgi:hypothetical protein